LHTGILMTDENDLLKRLKEDDVEALHLLFDRYFGDLNRYLCLLFKNEVMAENIAQDIFVYIWEQRHKLEIHSSLEAYLYTAGRYRALNQLRNEKLHKHVLQKIRQSEPDAFDLNNKIEMIELENLIEEAVSSLPERCQKIFRMSRYDELSYKAIAGLLGISVNTVENQMSIALKKLRKVLKPFYLQMLLSL
jgi:RNA polymerase sigma-70 factor, ECF subfamily